MSWIANFYRTIDVIPTISFVVSAIVWRTGYYNLGLYVLIPIVIVHAFWKYGNIIIESRYWKPMLNILFWMLLSSAISDYVGESFRNLVPIIASIFFSLSIMALSSQGNNANMFALGFICLFVAILYFTLTRETYTADFDYANEAERRGNTEMNSNQYAYFSLFAIMSVRLLLGNKHVCFFIRMILYLLLAGLAFFVALLTASRQVLLLEIPLLLFFVFYDYRLQGARKGKMVYLFMGILFLLFFIPQISSLYESSFLAARSDEDIEDDARSYLLIKGINQGIENPLFGVGLGYKTFFTHCTYTHLWGRCGIPVLLGYLYVIYIAIKDQYRRFKKSRDNYYLMYLFLLIVFFIANFFYSYIDQPFMLSIMFLLIGYSDNRFQKIAKS